MLQAIPLLSHLAAKDGHDRLMIDRDRSSDVPTLVYLAFRPSLRPLPKWRFSALLPVMGVVVSGAQPQVSGIDAASPVPAGARVKNEEAIGDGAMMKLPRVPVCQHRPLMRSEGSISPGVLSARPQPACLCFLNPTPETLLGRTIAKLRARLRAEPACCSYSRLKCLATMLAGTRRGAHMIDQSLLTSGHTCLTT